MSNRVRVLFNDQLNIARGKYIPLSEAKSGKVHFCTGTYALTYCRDLIPAAHSYLLEGLPDFDATFSCDAMRPSWGNDNGIAIADLLI